MTGTDVDEARANIRKEITKLQEELQVLDNAAEVLRRRAPSAVLSRRESSRLDDGKPGKLTVPSKRDGVGAALPSWGDAIQAVLAATTDPLSVPEITNHIIASGRPVRDRTLAVDTVRGTIHRLAGQKGWTKDDKGRWAKSAKGGTA